MPTRDDYEHAIGRAQRAGDDAAVQDLIQRAASEVTGKAGIAANLGAGVSNFIEGAKGLVGQGMSDDDLREKRRIDQMAADSTPGGALAQMVGESAPSFLIPGGAGAKVLTKALGRAPLAAGARVPTMIGAGGAALENAAASAFMPTTSDESKLSNIALGGAFGAGMPVLAKTLGAGYRVGRNLVDRGIAALPGRLGEDAAQRLGVDAATREFTRAGVELDPRRYAAQDYQPNTSPTGARGQPLAEFAPSTAAAYHETTPQLATVERASRITDPSWAARDAAEAKKRWNRLDTNLRTEGDVEAAQRTASAMKPPTDIQGPKLWESNMAGFTRNLENLTGSQDYLANPTFQHAVDFLRKRIDMGTVTPEGLHGLRKTLASGLAGPPGMSDSAIRGASKDVGIQRLIADIDNVMENSIPAKNRGAWGNWRTDYSANLAEGEAAKAEHGMRRAFVDEHGNPLSGMGETPDITLHKLQREADKIRTVERGPRTGQRQLSPQAEQAVSDLLTDLRANGVLKQIEKAATAGGGSATAMNLAALGAGGVLGEMLADHMGTGAVGMLALTHSHQNVGMAQRAIMSRIMQDPAQFRAFVQQASQRAQQLAQQQGTSGGRTARYLPRAVAATSSQYATEPEQKR